MPEPFAAIETMPPVRQGQHQPASHPANSVGRRRRTYGRMTTYLVQQQQAEALPQDRSMYDMVGWLAGGLVEQQGQIHSFITSTDGKERPCTCLTYHNSDSACYNVTKRMSVSGCLQVNNPCHKFRGLNTFCLPLLSLMRMRQILSNLQYHNLWDFPGGYLGQKVMSGSC